MLRHHIDLADLAPLECGLDLCLAYAINNLLGNFLLHTVGDFLYFINNFKNLGKTALLQGFLRRGGI